MFHRFYKNASVGKLRYTFRSFRAARRTELEGATRMEGITTTDWTKDYAGKSPLQISTTDVQKEVTLSRLQAPVEGK